MALPNKLNFTISSVLQSILVVLILCSSPVAFAQQDSAQQEQLTDSLAVEEEPGNNASADQFLPVQKSVISKRLVNTEARKKLTADEDFWYANKDFRQLQEADETNNGGGKGKHDTSQQRKSAQPATNEAVKERSWLRTIVWLITVTGFMLALGIFLRNSNIGLFRKRTRSDESRDQSLAVSEDIFTINYQADIDKAAAQGNYRLAIRLMFLRLLKQLAEKEIIQYRAGKTNFDYLQELRASSYYNDFFRLTRNYEYSWYGLFPVTQQAYEQVRRDFESIKIAH